MKVTIVPVTAFAQNCSLLCCEATTKAAVVDPGGELERILQTAEQAGVEIEKILVTHGHIDHAGGVADLAERLGVPVEGPQREDQFWIDALPVQSQQFGLPPARSFVPDRWLQHGDTVNIGQLELEVRHCPGHTPGHVIFFHAPSRLAIVGDVLFKGSIGRTDFPRGDHATLVRSIREQLWPLGDDVQFFPGHGPVSTFGDERRTNPFVGDHAGSSA
ncbi:MAG: MBL fold metallo-hydrolase [Gammaproteobacteria bacterium]|nr:MAG: MBL fold metallo-hydrolase [Gammaproteobacteria bacterium]